MMIEKLSGHTKLLKPNYFFLFNEHFDHYPTIPKESGLVSNGPVMGGCIVSYWAGLTRSHDDYLVFTN